MTNLETTKAHVLLYIRICKSDCPDYDKYKKMLLESGCQLITPSSCDEPGLVKYASEVAVGEKYFKRVECTILQKSFHTSYGIEQRTKITFMAPHIIYRMWHGFSIEDRKVTLQVPSCYSIEVHNERLVTVGIKKTRWVIDPDAEYISKPIEEIITPNGLLLDIKGKLNGGDYGFVKILQQYDVTIEWWPENDSDINFSFLDLENNYSMGYQPNAVYAPSDRPNDFF
jgi:hypothetical protein